MYEIERGRHKSRSVYLQIADGISEMIAHEGLREGDRLREELHAEQACIHLTGDCFVDEVLRREGEDRLEVMLPGRRVAARLEQEPAWRGIPFSGLYQHEFREIDGSFPYPGLTLSQLGIPDRDVLYVTADAKDCYMQIG